MNHVKLSELQYRWSKSHQVLLVMPSQEGSMIDGVKHVIEGVNHDIDGGKCQVVKYFVVSSSQI